MTSVKSTAAETNVTGYLVMDLSASMAYTYRQQLTKFEYAICLAAALGYLMIHQQDPVGLVAFDSRIRASLPPRSKRAHLGNILSVLAGDRDVLLAGRTLNAPEVLDVREIPQGPRHPRIFGIYARLTPGESFVLVNNHDPIPLRREFQAAYPDRFGWDYLEAGPERWRVRIGRLSVDA